MCLGSHYRKVLEFSFDALDNATNAYNKLKNKINELKEENNVDLESSKKYMEQFKNALENDLNTSAAITTLYDTLKSDLNDSTKLYLVSEFDKVLGLNLLVKENNKIDAELEFYILEKIEMRNNAKKNKDYILADQIREELKDKGIIIKDTREGTIYEIV